MTVHLGGAMSSNEAVALDANFKSWQEKRFPTPPKDLNVFEYYCVDQFLRQFDLSDSQLKTGLIGGGKDGGVDALYMFVTGELVEAETELDPKTPNQVRLLVMQMKEGDGFSPVAVDKLNFFADDLLELTRKKADYHQTYRDELIKVMRLVKDKYLGIVGENPPLSVDFYYITKKDVDPNNDCNTSAKKVIEVVRKHFPNAKADFHFVNASALWQQVQARPSKTKNLKWSAQSLSTPEGQIGLVRLPDYFAFVTESNGQLAERFFDSNVRGYWKTSSINKRIASTLKAVNPPEFWVLNNGITILTEKIGTGGHLEVEVTDPQIVNGLQTSREIYNHFSIAPPIPSDNRRLLVRLITTTDTAIRDSVIRSTNSQNEMPEEALRATDAIHRQIETLFHRYSLYYDRRQGYYRDQGKPVAQIVSVVELVQAVLSVVLRRPDEARGRPRDYIKKDDPYSSIFGKDRYDLNIYLKSIQIVLAVENFLDTLGLETVHRRNIPYWLCMYATCAKIGSAYAPPMEISKLDASTLTPSFLKDCSDRVFKQYDKLAEKYKVNEERDYDALAKGQGGHLLKAINAELKRRFNPKKKK
jgi:AIPR protein